MVLRNSLVWSISCFLEASPSSSDLAISITLSSKSRFTASKSNFCHVSRTTDTFRDMINNFIKLGLIFKAFFFLISFFTLFTVLLRNDEFTLFYLNYVYFKI
ncbi:hypothetical protein BpHYR1_002380 [Brachionus plicatilis]|uniref:Uncharacterized protein n=1 Tax=Brachionus plicatilis TaxID=10195 RepID=A0A3M7QE47_BRAPC|nr:hypothetical protein BpHYR1_002380 [Brachionus plicatilis]